MKATIIVQNLKCGGCARTITNKLSEMENISEVDVITESSSVTFTYAAAEDTLRVKDKLKELGYPSVDSKNTFATKAKSFVSCATGKMSKE
ncbi:heavy-metal-associated domain-containing protein [Maribacter sp. ANRC-HE7]|uniref:Heavy-metal-associated domain-containing protein n=1 Tax=Maribacter aquimaris TaxID=2737171 RepID=A0ABR7UWV4_9FLAO|nr:heavy metal-associated domain-containing protein [Maribacter aquimaris]MBD0776923.1 heavy-metal-associated domain-containing protein [Maribacter aquimaris]